MATGQTHLMMGRRWGGVATLLAGWRYRPHGRRDLRLDLLRGCLVVAMLVDHLGGNSWLFVLTGGNRFYVSAAEGFVFLSGLVMGIVYARLIAREGLWAATKRALRRAGTLYLMALLLAVGFTVASHLLGTSWAVGSLDLGGLIIGVATLQTHVYLADVLMLYAVLVLLAPAALWLLARGRTRLLLAGSGTLWLLSLLGVTGPVDQWTRGLAVFTPSAWQVVFAGGLALGYHWPTLAARAQGWRLERALVPIALAAGGLIGLSIWAPSSPVAEPLAAVFDKTQLRPGRLLAGLVFFPPLFGIATLAWRPLVAGLGWLLVPLGQAALPAYSLHLFLMVLANVYLPQVPGYDLEHAPINTAMHLLAVLVLWAVVRWLPAVGAAVVAFPARWWARRGAAGAFGGVRAGLIGAPLLLVAAGLTGSGLGGDALSRPTGPVTSEAVGGATVSLISGDAAVDIAAHQGQAAPARATPGAKRPAPAAASPIARSSVAAPVPNVDQVIWEGTPTAQGMSVVHERRFFSPALGREMSYLIYQPAGYEQSRDRYPVLYLLHGIGGGMWEWVETGLLETMDDLVRGGDVPPMLIVLPEGEQSYWVNHVDGPRWGDYVADDLVAHIDATYRTITGPEGRAVGGLSMGAHGALQLVMRYPDRFGAVGAHSPSLRRADDTFPFLGTTDDFDERDPLWLARAGHLPTTVRLWLDSGEADPWLEQVVALHEALAAQGVSHTWQTFPGAHDGAYWAEHVADYLRFYGEALQSSSGAEEEPR